MRAERSRATRRGAGSCDQVAGRPAGRRAARDFRSRVSSSLSMASLALCLSVYRFPLRFFLLFASCSTRRVLFCSILLSTAVVIR